MKNLLQLSAQSRKERRKAQREIAKHGKPETILIGIHYKGDTPDGISMTGRKGENDSLFKLFEHCLTYAELMYDTALTHCKNQSELSDVLLYQQDILLPESIEAFWKGIGYSSGKQPQWKSFNKVFKPKDVENLRNIFECVYFLEQEGWLLPDNHNGMHVMTKFS